MVHQGRDVVDAIAQGRHRQRHHVEAVEEIFPKAARLHLGFEVAVGGGDDAHIHRQLALGADRPDGFLFQSPQQGRLHGERHLAYLVQKEGALVGDPEQAVAPLAGAGEGPLHVAEQLAFQQLGGDGGTVERHEGPHPAGELMQGAGHQLLAGAGLPLHQHGSIGGRHSGDECLELPGLGAVADQGGREQLAHLPAQQQVLPLHLAALYHPVHRLDHLIQVEGLEDKVAGTESQRLEGGIHVTEAGHEDDVAAPGGGVDGLVPLDAGAPRQPDVGDDEIEMQAAAQGFRLLHAGGCLYLGEAPGQRLGQKAAHAGLVIDDEQREGRPTAGGCSHEKSTSDSTRFRDCPTDLINCGTFCR